MCPHSCPRGKLTTGAVASLALLDSKQMLLVGDAGGCLGMWTLNGTLIGRFGSQTWDVSEPTTWHDAEVRSSITSQSLMSHLWLLKGTVDYLYLHIPSLSVHSRSSGCSMP